MSNPRRRTRDQVLKALLTAWRLPEPTEIVRSQRAVEVRYSRNGVRRTLSVHAGFPGQLEWSVRAADDELIGIGGFLFEARLWVRSEAIWLDRVVPEDRYRGEYPWPVAGDALDSRLIDDGLRYVGPMLDFFRDRADLGRLLIATNPHKPWWFDPDTAPDGGSWQRGEIVATPASSTPAGVVMAVVLARHTGDEELERLAMSTLGDLADQIVHGAGIPFSQAVGGYAEKYQEWSPSDLADLAQLAPKRRRRKA